MVAVDQSSAMLCPVGPNWRADYTVAYEFRTDIFTADSGLEQRRALRPTPRRSIRFLALAHEDRLRAFNRFIDTAHASEVILPEVVRAVTVTSAAGSALTIAGQLPGWLAVGSEIVVSRNGYSLHQVAAVAGQTVTLTDAPADMGRGALIHPALRGRLESRLIARRVTSRTAEADVNFVAKPGSEHPQFGSPGEMLDGLETPTLDHNWQGGLGVEHEWPIGTIDFGRGTIEHFTTVQFPTSVRTIDLTVRDPAPWVNLFGRMRGQQGAFLLSSMEQDMVPISVTGSELVIRGTELVSAYADDPVRGAIEVAAVGGIHRRRITAMRTLAGNSVLTLAEPLPHIAADAVLRVSWLTAVRFASDVLEVVYSTTRAARIRLNVRTLPMPLTPDGVLRATTEGDLRATTEGDLREVVEA